MRTKREIKLKRWEISLLLALVCTMLWSSWAGFREAKLAGQVLRMHVVANSDEEQDQMLKRAVRDAVVRRAEETLKGCTSAGQARERLADHVDELARSGAQVVEQKGYAYPVIVSLGNRFYPTKYCENYGLPAGSYQALCVEIGAARGHNWWSVIYPALSEDAVAEYAETALGELDREDWKLIREEEGGYVLRFRCLEWYGRAKEMLRKWGRHDGTPAAVQAVETECLTEQRGAGPAHIQPSP